MYSVLKIEFDEDEGECSVVKYDVPDENVGLTSLKKFLGDIMFDVVCVGKIDYKGERYNVDIFINDNGMYEEEYLWIMKTGVTHMEIFGESLIVLSNSEGETIAMNDDQLRDVFENYIAGKIMKDIFKFREEVKNV